MACGGCGKRFKNLGKPVPTNSVSVSQPLTQAQNGSVPPLPRVRSNRGVIRQLVVPPPPPSTETKS